MGERCSCSAYAPLLRRSRLQYEMGVTISLHLSHVNPSLLTEIDKLYMWQTVLKTIAGEETITHRD